MAKMLSKVAPWLASRSDTGGFTFRNLVHEDTAALRDLTALDPVANVFVASQLEGSGTAVPPVTGAIVLGCFTADGALASACWIGANVVPVGVTADQAVHFGQWIVSSQRRIASIFGPADAVLGIYRAMADLGAACLEVRANQPLLEARNRPALPGHPGLRPSHSDDYAEILPAAAAMFEEEVGYSPFLGGDESYRRRVAALIRQGHSFSHLDPLGRVIFKADLGAVSRQVSQIQGVWLAPEYRGQGLSAAYMAAVVQLALDVAPVTSLYVNDYNARARATYSRVGFSQVGTFATVLF
ncbi:MAG: GNAT family N-acetyltransferase [Actinomycetales bacterium]